MTSKERAACYMAQRIIRAADPAKTAKKHGVDKNAFVMALVSELPALLNMHCMAVAEAIAVERCGGSINRFN